MILKSGLTGSKFGTPSKFSAMKRSSSRTQSLFPPHLENKYRFAKTRTGSKIGANQFQRPAGTTSGPRLQSNSGSKTIENSVSNKDSIIYNLQSKFENQETQIIQLQDQNQKLSGRLDQISKEIKLFKTAFLEVNKKLKFHEKTMKNNKNNVNQNMLMLEELKNKTSKLENDLTKSSIETTITEIGLINSEGEKADDNQLDKQVENALRPILKSAVVKAGDDQEIAQYSN